MTMQFAGIVVPLLTPLDAERRVDHPAVGRLVDAVIDAGVDGLFVLGSGGEGPALRPAVRHALVDAVVEAAAGRCPVIAGVLEPSTDRVIEEIHALAGRGLAGYVATTPYYYTGFRESDLLAHFRHIAGAADRPVLLYNIPQLTRVPLTPGLVAQLAAEPNIVGIKDSGGDWSVFEILLRERRDPSFAIFQGAQGLCAQSLLAGADGLVPGYANVSPRLFVELRDAARRGDSAAATTCQEQIDALLDACGRVKLHASKVLAAALGLMEDHQPLPLPRLDAEEVRHVLAASAAAGLALPDGTASRLGIT